MAEPAQTKVHSPSTMQPIRILTAAASTPEKGADVRCMVHREVARFLTSEVCCNCIESV